MQKEADVEAPTGCHCQKVEVHHRTYCQFVPVMAADNHQDQTNDELQLRIEKQILDQDQIDRHKEIRVAAAAAARQ